MPDILIVEDNPVNQKLIAFLLAREGHSYEVAENGLVALEKLKRSRFRLVLMDMMMPVMDGLEATQRLRGMERGKTVPIIAMTANAMQGDRERCLQAGMDDYLAKPIKSKELQAALERFRPGARTHQSVDVSPVVPPREPQLVAQGFDFAQALAAQDAEMVDIVAEVFVSQWPSDELKMRDALRRGDAHALELIAHSLKGSLHLFGAQPAALAAQAIESLAQSGQCSAAQAQVDALCQHVQALIRVLHQRPSLSSLSTSGNTE